MAQPRHYQDKAELKKARRAIVREVSGSPAVTQGSTEMGTEIGEPVKELK